MAHFLRHHTPFAIFSVLEQRQRGYHWQVQKSILVREGIFLEKWRYTLERECKNTECGRWNIVKR